MSEEQLKAFIAKVQADTSLQEQLKAEGADVVAIAKAAGFAITEAPVCCRLIILSQAIPDSCYCQSCWVRNYRGRGQDLWN